MNKIIEVKHLKKNYGDKEVLKDINAVIEKGKVITVIGPSGSGKSTFLRCLNLLEKPTSGQVIFEGTELTDLNEEELDQLRQKMGMVFQSFNLFPNMSVIENVKLAPMKVKGMSDQEAGDLAHELLAKVGLDDFADHSPASLSGGQQQRVAIARAMASQPQLILMDESFSALDPVLRRQQQELLLDLHRQSKTTVVFVTHDMQEALRLGDRIGVIQDSCLMQVGSPEEIVQKPANSFVADFFKSARPRLGTMLELLASPYVNRITETDLPEVEKVEEVAGLAEKAGFLQFAYQGAGYQIKSSDLLHYFGKWGD